MEQRDLKVLAMKMGVMWPQGKDCPQPSEDGEGKDRILPSGQSPWREHSAAVTLILDVWPPELWGYISETQSSFFLKRVFRDHQPWPSWIQSLYVATISHMPTELVEVVCYNVWKSDVWLKWCIGSNCKLDLIFQERMRSNCPLIMTLPLHWL